MDAALLARHATHQDNSRTRCRIPAARPRPGSPRPRARDRGSNLASSPTLIRIAAVAVAVALGSIAVAAHPLTGRNAAFVQNVDGTAVAPFMYLGAKHMVTGYDHLLFLVGVIFFLYRLKDVVLYVSLFTIGHSLTLLVGVLGGIHANPYVIDAIIGLSVVYKAFENIG